MREKRRIKLLSSAIAFLENMHIDISYQSLPIKRIMIDNVGTDDFSRTMAYYALKEENFHIAWRKAIDRIDGVTKEDKLFLSAIGNELGNADTKSQLLIIDKAVLKLKKIYDEAIENRRKRGNMYRSVGLLLGFGFGIIIV